MPVALRAEIGAPFLQPARQQLQVVLGGDADGTVHRMGDGHHLLGRLAGACLGHRGAQRVRRDAVAGAADLGRHACGEHLLGHDAELLLHRLELADRLAELRTVVGDRPAWLRARAASRRPSAWPSSARRHAAGRWARAAARRRPARAGQWMWACRLPCTPLGWRSPAATGSSAAPCASLTSTQSDTTPKGTFWQRHAPCASRLHCAASVSGPLRCRHARQRQHGTHPGRLGQRHRQRMAAAGQPQREGVAQPQAGATGRLVHQQLGIARRLDLGPQRGRALAALHLAHHGRRAAAGQRSGSIDSNKQGIHQRNPSPRAITPRRISRVPPRSEKVGQTCST